MNWQLKPEFKPADDDGGGGGGPESDKKVAAIDGAAPDIGGGGFDGASDHREFEDVFPSDEEDFETVK